MARGECPLCVERYDTALHMPMVSTACGHSVCASCARSGSDARCPSCQTPFESFVKNFEALAALDAGERRAGSDRDATGSAEAGSAVSPTNSPPLPAASTSVAPAHPEPLPYPELDGDVILVNEEELVDMDDAGSSPPASPTQGLQASSSTSSAVPQRIQSSTSMHTRPLEDDVADVGHVIDRSDLHFSRSHTSELGQGSSGIVYRGSYGDNQRLVAIKAVRAQSHEVANSDRFRRELQLVSRLRDSHIVDFVGAAWDEDEEDVERPPTILLVAELMSGGTLRSALSSLPAGPVGGLEVHSFLTIATHIARGLVYLHAEGFAHRDIKSANILLTEPLIANSNAFPDTVRAKIADFGLSKSIDKLTGGAAFQQSIMEPGRLEATYAYLAPEAFGGDKTNVIRNDDDDDARLQETAKKRDIYALGVLFWEMITGRVPWAGTSLPDVYVRVCVRSDRPTPSLEDSKVPKTLRRLVERCWNQDAKKRPSAASIVDKLERMTQRLQKGNTEAQAVSSNSGAAAAAVAASNGATTTTGGVPDSPSYWSTTTPKGVSGEGPRQKQEEDEAGVASHRRVPAIIQEQQQAQGHQQVHRPERQRSADVSATNGPGPHGNAADRRQSRPAQGRQTPVSRPAREAPIRPSPGAPAGLAASPAQLAPAASSFQTGVSPSQGDFLSSSVPVSSAGNPLIHSRPASLAPTRYSGNPRDVPRSSSSAVPGSGTAERLADRGPSAFDSTTPSTGNSTVRRSSDSKDPVLRPRAKPTPAEAFTRSPSYGGPATTSGALTGTHCVPRSGQNEPHSMAFAGDANGGDKLGVGGRQAKRMLSMDTGKYPAVQKADADADDADFAMADDITGHGDLLDESQDEYVNSLSSSELLSVLSQKHQGPRLASLALAALLSQKHSRDETVVRNACAILHRLTLPSGTNSSGSRSVSALEQLAIRKYLKSNGAVRALLDVVDNPGARHPTTTSYALLGLGNLTAWDLDAHKQFRNANGVARVGDCMRARPIDAGIQEKACYALACVGASYPAKSKSVFLATGCVNNVCAALDAVQNRGELGDAVTKQACAALGAMCSGCSENASHAASIGGIGQLVAAFDNFRDSSQGVSGKRSEMHLVGSAFMNLMCTQENRRHAGSHGGTALMLRCMRVFRLDADFVEKCLSTLSEFCTFRANASQVVQMNGVDDIIAAMIRFKTSVPVQRAGCRTLSALMKASGDNARRRVVQASGGEAIVFALERFGVSAGANVPVAVEGCRAIAALCSMENAEEGEILARRMRKIRTDRALKQTMQAHKGHTGVEEKAREALKNLGSLKSGNGFFSRIRSSKR